MSLKIYFQAVFIILNLQLMKNTIKKESYSIAADLTYTLIRSQRRSIALQINEKQEIIVRAPIKISNAEIHKFVCSKENWIRKHLAAKADTAPAQPKLTPAELQKLAQEALNYIPQRTRHYASIIGVTYGNITIRNQKTRWGSCSSKGNLNFNCLLMLMPAEVIDSVIVHELCHRKEMNHSKRFYAEIYKVFPEYDKWNKWLKDNGSQIMQRML